MKIQLIADSASGGGAATPPAKPETPAVTIARLTTENESLKTQVAADRAADSQRAADEAEIAKKVGVGLTRDQAIAVIKRQKDHDTALADKYAKRLPRLKEIILGSDNQVEARRAARIEFPDLDGGEFNDAVKAARAKK